MDEVYEYDKATKQYFCKYCGNNYLLKDHKESCLMRVEEFLIWMAEESRTTEISSEDEALWANSVLETFYNFKDEFNKYCYSKPSLFRLVKEKENQIDKLQQEVEMWKQAYYNEIDSIDDEE